MYMRFMLLGAFLCGFFGQCNTQQRPDPETMDSIYLSYNHQIVPFAFYEPDTAYELLPVLQEISALTWLPDEKLAAVEDEHGIVYILNTQGEILEELEFGDDGDYEAIEFVDGRFFILNSDGDLYEFRRGSPGQARKTSTDLDDGNEPEGLGVLEGNLLVALKGKGDAGEYEASGKGVYTMDMVSGELLDLIIEVDEDMLEDLLTKRREELKVTDFDPSSVAVDPVTGNIYLLSADMLLAVFQADGQLLEVVPLFANMYRQPEGIAFTPDGDLYISSEGAGQAAQLFLLRRK